MKKLVRLEREQETGRIVEVKVEEIVERKIGELALALLKTYGPLAAVPFAAGLFHWQGKKSERKKNGTKVRV